MSSCTFGGGNPIFIWFRFWRQSALTPLAPYPCYFGSVTHGLVSCMKQECNAKPGLCEIEEYMFIPEGFSMQFQVQCNQIFHKLPVILHNWF